MVHLSMYDDCPYCIVQDLLRGGHNFFQNFSEWCLKMREGKFSKKDIVIGKHCHLSFFIKKKTTFIVRVLIKRKNPSLLILSQSKSNAFCNHHHEY